MNCEEFQQQLSDWLERELTEARRAAMREHAHLCPACGELADTARAQDAMARRLFAAQAPGPDFVEATMQAIAMQEERAAESRGGAMLWVPWMAMAAMALIAVIALNQRDRQNRPDGNPPAFQATDATDEHATRDGNAPAGDAAVREAEAAARALEEKLRSVKLKEIRFHDQSLTEICQFLSEAGGIPVLCDQEAGEFELTLEISTTISAMDLVDIVQRLTGVRLVFRNGMAWLSSRVEGPVETVIYDIQPVLDEWLQLSRELEAREERRAMEQCAETSGTVVLASRESDEEVTRNFADLFLEIIRYGADAWDESEGWSRQVLRGGRLSARCDVAMHARIRNLLKLLKSHSIYDPAGNDSIALVNDIHKRLVAVSLENFDTTSGTTVDQALRSLSDATGIIFLSTSGQCELPEIQLSKTNADQALQAILAGLSWQMRVCGKGGSTVVYLGSPGDLRNAQPLEFALFDIRFEPDFSADEIIDLLRSQVRPESWDCGDAAIVALPGHLLVLQDAQTLGEIHGLIEKLRNPVSIEDE